MPTLFWIFGIFHKTFVLRAKVLKILKLVIVYGKIFTLCNREKDLVIYLHVIFNTMKVKKIIAWLVLLIMVVLTIYFMNKDVDGIGVFFLIGSVYPFTLIIHYYSVNKKLIKIVKWTFFVLLLLLSYAVITNVFGILYPLPEIFISLFSILIVTTVLFLIESSERIDFFIIILLIVSIVGIIFKYLHWPGAGVFFTVGFTLPGILFFFIIHHNINEYDGRTNRFLNFFKNFICITLIISFLGLTFKMMHWPGGDVLKTISLPLFILSLTSMVFLLPVSNFIEWTRKHKRMFYRALLVPLLYMTIITAMANVFPVTFQGFFFQSRSTLIGFNLYYYDIPPKDGME